MFGFHKPKMYRSIDGCCICRAKSSSSRFTDSKRYETNFKSCFGLGEVRCGDICNACVLLVKRWKKLPAGSKKNWNHVVDAKAGSSMKATLRTKKMKKKLRPSQISRVQSELKRNNRRCAVGSCTRDATEKSSSIPTCTSPAVRGNQICTSSRKEMGRWRRRRRRRQGRQRERTQRACHHTLYPNKKKRRWRRKRSWVMKHGDGSTGLVWSSSMDKQPETLTYDTRPNIQ